MAFLSHGWGATPVRDFLTSFTLPPGDRDEVLAAMTDVQISGLIVARHLRGEIYEVRASGARAAYRVLFASDGATSQVLLAVSAFTKKTQRTPPAEIRLAERRLADWGRRGHQAVTDIWVKVRGVQGARWPAKDDLDQLIDELAEEDAALPLRVAAALERHQSGTDHALRVGR